MDAIEKKRDYTPARYAANARYNAKTYTKIGVDVPKDLAKAFKEKCEKTGTKQRQVLLNAIEKFLNE